MVEEVSDLLVEADVVEPPVVALLAERAHGELVALLARLHGDRVVVHRDHAVQEDEHAHHGRGQQPARVET